MNSSAFSTWPPTLTDAQMQLLETEAIDWAISNGLVMRDSSNATVHAPFALFPSPVPATAFQAAVRMQSIFNAMVHSVSQDKALMREVFEPLSVADPEFTGKLYAIYRKWCGTPPPNSGIVVGLHRSDYMLHKPLNGDGVPVLQQVEFNTVAASFAALSSKVSQMHSFLAKQGLYCNSSDPSTLCIVSNALPVNGAVHHLADFFSQAHTAYGVSDSIIVIVVQPNERNISDQRNLEYALFEKYGIRMIRKTLLQLSTHCKNIGSDKVLRVDGHQVSVIYYRAGYGPNDYTSSQEWVTRSELELCSAIKCPNICYQLVGAKKVQQMLTLPGVLEKYTQNDDDAQFLRSCFTGMYALDETAQSKIAFEKAMSNPDDFVLKPQREGGGNNFYGDAVKNQLKSMSATERGAYILMDRIRPPPFKNVLVRNGQATEAQVISELGIYGTFISNGNHTLNKSSGHLLRTKVATTDEGGVATGFSVIDSPLLF